MSAREFVRGHWRDRAPKSAGIYPAVTKDGRYVAVRIRFDADKVRNIIEAPLDVIAWWWSLPFPRAHPIVV